jgi:hypothetical protein
MHTDNTISPEQEIGVRMLREYEPPLDLKDTAYTFSITALSKTTEDTAETDGDDEEYIDTHWESETWESNLSKEDAVKVLLEFFEVYDGIEIDVVFEGGLSKPLWSCLDDYDDPF